MEGVVGALEEVNLLDRTYVLYSSDHGFHIGHMRLGFVSLVDVGLLDC